MGSHYDVPMGDFPTEYEDCVVGQMPIPMTERPLIYVAGYFSVNPMHGTVNAVNAAKRLLAAGWTPLVPHTSLLFDMVMPSSPEFWYELDLAYLLRCDAMYVCPDALTAESSGVAKEIAFCTKHDIPVYYEVVNADERYER